MPRPMKWRKVCCMPEVNQFGPLDYEIEDKECIVMTVDEYETIRLIDLMGMNQVDCAASMNVARTTVQGIYNEARRKLAESIVKGKILKIAGGEYKLCDKGGQGCGRGCRRREMRQTYNREGGCHENSDTGEQE